MSSVVSILLGAAVCLFGIWAFLKGQRSMLQIKSGGLPDSLFPKELPRGEKNAPGNRPTLSEQLQAMFGDDFAEEEVGERR